MLIKAQYKYNMFEFKKMFGFFWFMQCASSYFLSLHFLYSSRFVTPPTGSSSRYMGQQNSPVPSPYTPQSPATGYIQQYPHQQPPSYNQHQQIQQGENLCLMLMRMHGDSELIINFFSNVKLATKSDGVFVWFRQPYP